MKNRYKIIIIIVAAILAAIIGIIIPKILQPEGIDVYSGEIRNNSGQAVRKEADDNDSLKSTFIDASQKNNQGAKNDQKRDIAGSEDQGTDNADSVENTRTTEADKKNTSIYGIKVAEDGIEAPDSAEDLQTGTPEMLPFDIEHAVINRTWVEQKIKEHESQIDPNDLEDFRSIIGKLDMDYIAEIFRGGLTEEKQAALREYLMNEVTESEYQRAKELFLVYNDFLFNK